MQLLFFLLANVFCCEYVINIYLQCCFFFDVINNIICPTGYVILIIVITYVHKVEGTTECKWASGGYH